jgi:osmotically-inducible protein OsmY
MTLASQFRERDGLAGVEISVQDGLVILAGMTPTLRDKVFAELLASRLDGVLDVDNQIVVRPSDTPPPAAP